MTYVLVGTFGLMLWVVLWAIGIKSFDAFMLLTLIMILAVIGKMAVPLIPGLRED